MITLFTRKVKAFAQVFLLFFMVLTVFRGFFLFSPLLFAQIGRRRIKLPAGAFCFVRKRARVLVGAGIARPSFGRRVVGRGGGRPMCRPYGLVGCREVGRRSRTVRRPVPTVREKSPAGGQGFLSYSFCALTPAPRRRRGGRG